MNTKRRKIDSYGKLFPLVENEKNTAVYRITTTFKDNIDLKKLSEALSITMKKFPDFQVTLKKNFFTYYLEPNYNKVKIIKDPKDICSKLNLKINNGYLFRVSHTKKKVSIDFYHILTDGAGANLFTKELVETYLAIVNNKKNSHNKLYYCKDCYKKEKVTKNNKSIKKIENNKKSYIISGNASETSRYFTEITAEVEPLKSFCKKNHITITAYITTLLIKSIYETHKENIKDNQHININIPVDIRKFYKLETASNFFDYFNVSISKKEAKQDINTIFKKVKNIFEEKIKPEYFMSRVKNNVLLLNFPLFKIVPLVIKKNISKMAYKTIIDSGTVLLSNIGIIPISPEYNKYIDKVSLYVNPEEKTYKCSICSFNNKISIIFSTYQQNSKIEEKFCEYLQKNNLNHKVIKEKVDI